MPALVFALGMYLPLELNLPALVGGVLAHYLGKRADRLGRDARADHARARRDHRVGLHGRRRAGRRDRRGAAAVPAGIARTWSRRRSSITTPCRRSCRPCCSPACAPTCGGIRRGRWSSGMTSRRPATSVPARAADARAGHAAGRPHVRGAARHRRSRRSCAPPSARRPCRWSGRDRRRPPARADLRAATTTRP